MASNGSSDVYDPEWLELEKGLGSRPQLAADINIDVPTFNGLGEQLAAQWPSIDEELTVVDEVIAATEDVPAIPVRVYAPSNNPGDLPLVVFFHGGGYISGMPPDVGAASSQPSLTPAGNIRTEDPHCRIISARAPAVVVNVEYPLGPAHTLDTIIKSGIIAVNWAASHSPPLTNSSSLLVVGGSAGASLAIQLTYHQTQSPAAFARPITGLGALFPFAHPAEPAYTGPHSEKHTSYADKATSAPILTRKVMLNFIHPNNPLGLSISATSPAHYPLLAPSLPNFPRTYIVTAEHDICRDDGRVLVLRLRDEAAASGSTEEMVREDYYEGLPHYFHWFPSLGVTGRAMEGVVRGLRWVAGREA